MTLIAGKAFDQKSPVAVYSDLFFMDVKLAAGKEFRFNPGDQELAFYILQGNLQVGDKTIAPDDFVVLQQGSSLHVTTTENARFIVLGGAPLPEQRHIYWNYVSSSLEKIEIAKQQWRDGSFPQVPGEPDIIPLPE